MATEPYCNHDAAAIHDGVCECGRMSFGDFMRAVTDLFPNAQVEGKGGELIIHTGLKEVYDEGGNCTVEPLATPNVTGV